MTNSEGAVQASPVKARRRINMRQAAWAAAAIIFAISLVLSVMTVRNYAEVAKAKVLTDIVTEESAAFGYDASGNLESVQMTLNFKFVNPSGKELKAWILTYKAWVRDLPAELGIDNSRWRVDGELVVNETTQVYFPVFVAAYSFGNPEVVVPPNSDITITERLYMNRSEYPDIMQGFEAILAHVAGAGLEMEWLHYTGAIILISDIPPYSGPNHDANLIRRYEGTDITPGVGGAGP